MNIKEEIKKRTEREIERMIRRAHRIAERELILANKKKEAELTKEKEKIDKFIEEKKQSAFSEIELEFKLKELKAKDELIEAIFKEVEEELSNIEKEDLEISFKNLILQGCQNLNAKRIILRVNKDSEKILSQIVKDLKAQGIEVINIEFQNILGGVIIFSENKERLFNNSFEERLNRFKEELKVEILEILENA